MIQYLQVSTCTAIAWTSYKYIFSFSIGYKRLCLNTKVCFRYNANVETHAGDGNTPLNGDHTHFIMVDDGSRYRFFGKSTDFITRFEDMVRSPEVRLYSKWS